MKIVKFAGILILLFLFFRICSSTQKEVDYESRVETKVMQSEQIFSNTYKTIIKFKNKYIYPLRSITAKFTLCDISGKPMAFVTKDILQSGLELPPEAIYGYELITKNYWNISEVKIIFAN